MAQRSHLVDHEILSIENSHVGKEEKSVPPLHFSYRFFLEAPMSLRKSKIRNDERHHLLVAHRLGRLEEVAHRSNFCSTEGSQEIVGKELIFHHRLLQNHRETVIETRNFRTPKNGTERKLVKAHPVCALKRIRLQLQLLLTIRLGRARVLGNTKCLCLEERRVCLPNVVEPKTFAASPRKPV